MNRLIVCCLLAFLSATAQAGGYIITNVNVVDVENGTIKTNSQVHIEGDAIKRIGPQLYIGKDTRVVDAKGGYLIPGLWDMHTHLQDLGDTSLQQYLYYGVTQIRDMGGDPELVSSYKNGTANGTFTGPDVYSSLYMIGSPRFEGIMQKILPKQEWEVEQKRRIIVSNSQEAEVAVKKIHDSGADFVKLHWNHNQQTLEAVIKSAKSLGLDVVGHDPGPDISLDQIAQSGMRSYEHVDGDFFYKLSQLSEKELTRTMDLFKQNDMHISATLVMWNAMTRLASIEDRSQALDILSKHPDGLAVDKKLVAFWEKIIPTFPPKLITWSLVGKDIHYLKTFYEAGVPVLASTDSGIPGLYPGYSLIEELMTLQNRIGISSTDALKMATWNAAKFMNKLSDHGSVDVNKKANLVLLNSNPLDSINALYDIKSVIKNGVLLERKHILN